MALDSPVQRGEAAMPRFDPALPFRALWRGLSRLRRRSLSALLAGSLAAGLSASLAPASAGTVLVVGDVNAARVGNMALFTNLLADGESVLFSRSGTTVNAVWLAFRAAPGVTATQTTAPLSDTVLAGLDVLVLSAGFDRPLNYTDEEMTAAATFLSTGGRLLLVAEAQNQTTVASYNAVLTRLGSGIRYTGTRIGSSETVAVASGDALVEGQSSFLLSKYNTLTGGTTLVSGAAGSVVAVDRLKDVAPVDLPGGLPLAASALAMLLLLSRTGQRSA